MRGSWVVNIVMLLLAAALLFWDVLVIAGEPGKLKWRAVLTTWAIGLIATPLIGLLAHFSRWTVGRGSWQHQPEVEEGAMDKMTEDARPVNANCTSNADSAATPDKSQASVALQSARDSPSQTSPRSESQGTTQYEYKSSSSSASASSTMHDNTHRVLQQKAGVTSADLRSAGPAAATSIPSFSPPYLKPVLNHVMSPDAMLVRQPVLESEIAKRVEDDQRRLQMSLPVASISAAPAVLAPAPIPMPLCAPPSPRSSSRSRQETKKRLFFEEVSAGLDRFCNTPVSVPATSAAPQVGPDPRNPLSPQPNPSSQSRRQSVAHAAAGGGDAETRGARAGGGRDTLMRREEYIK